MEAEASTRKGKKKEKKRLKMVEEASDPGSEIDQILLQLSETTLQLQHQNQTVDPDNEHIKLMKKATKRMSKSVRNLHNKLAEESKGSNFRNSWREKRSEIIPEPYVQTDNQCWTVGMYRGYWSMMKKCGLEPELSPDEIFYGVDIKHRNQPGGAIDSLVSAIPFMSSYANMKVYYRPKLDDVAGNIEFESFIEEKLRECPVMVSIDCLPSFLIWDANGLYVPTDEDCDARRFEKFLRHCMLLTGHGVQDGLRFWEAEDNFGVQRGDQGFIDFARDMCLIRAVIVFEVLPQE